MGIIQEKTNDPYNININIKDNSNFDSSLNSITKFGIASFLNSVLATKQTVSVLTTSDDIETA